MMQISKIDQWVFLRIMDTYYQMPQHIELDSVLYQGIESQLLASPQWVVHDNRFDGFIIVYEKHSKITLNPWIFGGLPVCKEGYELTERLFDETMTYIRDKHQERIDSGYSDPMTRVVMILNHNSLKHYDFMKAHQFLHDYDYCDMRLDIDDIYKNDIPTITLSKACLIKPLKEILITEIKQLYHRCFSSSDAIFYKRQTTKEKVEFFSFLNYDLAIQSQASFGIICQGRLIAYCMTVEFERSCNITCMCVDPEFWHTGFGSFMLKEVISRVKEMGIKFIELGTEAQMKAFKLYRKFGFHVIGTSNYYHYDLESFNDNTWKGNESRCT